MSKTVEYRGYTISSTPVKLSKKDEWKPEIEISSERDGIVTSRPYTDATTHTTEAGVDNHGSQLGQDIIDGKAPEVLLNYDEKVPFNASTPCAERL